MDWKIKGYSLMDLVGYIKAHKKITSIASISLVTILFLLIWKREKKIISVNSKFRDLSDGNQNHNVVTVTEENEDEDEDDNDDDNKKKIFDFSWGVASQIMKDHRLIADRDYKDINSMRRVVKKTVSSYLCEEDNGAINTILERFINRKPKLERGDNTTILVPEEEDSILVSVRGEDKENAEDNYRILLKFHKEFGDTFYKSPQVVECSIIDNNSSDFNMVNVYKMNRTSSVVSSIKSEDMKGILRTNSSTLQNEVLSENDNDVNDEEN